MNPAAPSPPGTNASPHRSHLPAAGLAIHLTQALVCVCLLAFATVHAAEAPRKPNFVFILVDDLGYMDIGANNPDTFYETPGIDRLAAQGVRFTQAYAACPVCSPTRASIMTGRYPARVRVTDFIGGRNKAKLLPADYLDHLPLEEVTIAEALKEAGYRTGFFGKWHLGSGDQYSPSAQGFEVNVGGTGAGAPSSYFSPYRNPKLPDGPPGECLTERLTREAASFIRSNRDQPFLAYLSHYTVHIPLQARRELVAKYEQKAARLPKTNSARFLPEGARQARQVQDHPVYAAMVESLDQSVGTILQTLDELRLADNTVVLFFSDNGGLSTAEGTPTSNVPLRAGKGWMYEGGIREPLIVRWPRTLPAGRVISDPVISMDFFPTMLEMAGLPQRPQAHVDGQSLLPLMKGGPAPKREGLFWHYPHYSNQGGAQVCAVRSGNWKLIRSFEGLTDELYDLNNDVREANNLASEYPEVVERLNQMLGGFLKTTKAEMPRPNPDYVAK